MYIKLTRTREVRGQKQAIGTVLKLDRPYGLRLIKIGDAVEVKDMDAHTEATKDALPDFPQKEKVVEVHGHDRDAIMDADLTEITGIGESTQSKIKNILSR